MALYRTTSTIFLLMAVSAVSISATFTTSSNIIPSRNQDVLVAIEEMQVANYFTFVMLINMSPLDLIQGNLTFLMPNDRMLSRTAMPETAVADFLLRHSIPSPMLFDTLQHIPTGSIIPSSNPEFLFKISNNGRRNFYLNNVRIISPNICTAGSSIRCHGIDGVLPVTSTTTVPGHNTTYPIPSRSNSSSPIPSASPPAPSLPSTPAPPVSGITVNPATAPPPADPNIHPRKSAASSQWVPCKGLLLAGCLILPLLVVSSI